MASSSGCDGCRGTATYINNNIKLRMADRCTKDTDCKQTCPQGNICNTYPKEWGGLDHQTCLCRDVFSGPCETALDCKMRSPGATCPKLFTCRHYPGSTVGSCECRADCETASDCPPIAGCPAGPVCQPFRWGDRGECTCASDVLDDGGVQ